MQLLERGILDLMQLPARRPETATRERGEYTTLDAKPVAEDNHDLPHKTPPCCRPDSKKQTGRDGFLKYF